MENFRVLLKEVIAWLSANVSPIEAFAGLVAIAAAVWAILRFTLWRPFQWLYKRTVADLSHRRRSATVSGLLGRDAEIRRFEELVKWWKTPETKVFGIHGPPGMGKSLLLYALVERCRQKGIRFAEIDFYERSQEQLDILDSIRLQLGAIDFSPYVHAREEYDRTISQLQGWEVSLPDVLERIRQLRDGAVDEFVDCLNNACRNRFGFLRQPIVLFFDTVERVTGTDVELWLKEVFIDRIKHKSNPILVVAGRERLSWEQDSRLGARDVDLQRLSIALTALCLRYRLGDVSTDLIQLTQNLTNGHPLGVGLCVNLLQKQKFLDESPLETIVVHRGGDVYDRRTVELLLEALIGELRSSEKVDEAEAVRHCALVDEFDVELIMLLLEQARVKSQSLLESLGQYAFVRPRAVGGYVYHELVRNVLIDKWLRDDRLGYKALNGKLVQYYESLLERQYGTEWSGLTVDRLRGLAGVEWRRYILRRVYHLIRAREEEAIRVIEELLNQVEFPRWHQFCREVIGTTVSYAAESPQTRIWFRLQQAVFGFVDPLPTLKEIFESGSTPTELRSRAAVPLGQMYIEQQKLDKAEECFAFFLQTQEDRSEDLARAMRKIAFTYEYAGRLHDTIRYLEESLQLPQSPNLTADTKMRIGIQYRRIGKSEKAQALLRESLERWQQLNDRRRISETSIALGDVCRLVGRWDDARRHYERVCTILKDIEEPGIYSLLLTKTLYASGRCALARYYLHQGQPTVAIPHLTEGVEIFEDLEYYFHLGWSRGLLGEAFLQLGQFEDAERNLLQGIQAAKQAKFKRHEAENLVNLCRLYQKWGKQRLLLETVSQARQTVEECEELDEMAKLNLIEADIQLAMNNIPEASAKLCEALINALRHNIKTLDDIIEQVEERINFLSERGNIRALSVLNSIITTWTAPARTLNMRSPHDYERDRSAELSIRPPREPILEYLQRLQACLSDND